MPPSTLPPFPGFLGLNWFKFIDGFEMVVFPIVLCHLTVKSTLSFQELLRWTEQLGMHRKMRIGVFRSERCGVKK